MAHTYTLRLHVTFAQLHTKTTRTVQKCLRVQFDSFSLTTCSLFFCFFRASSKGKRRIHRKGKKTPKTFVCVPSSFFYIFCITFFCSTLLIFLKLFFSSLIVFLIHFILLYFYNLQEAAQSLEQLVNDVSAFELRALMYVYLCIRIRLC